MKILFCSHLPLTKELGGSKVTTELAEAKTDIGWDCTLVGSNDVMTEIAPRQRRMPYRVSHE